MNHTDLTANWKASYFLAFSEPTLECVQQLLIDLYACARLDPAYLFLTEDDHSALSAAIETSSMMSMYRYSTRFASSFGFDAPLTRSSYHGIHHLSSAATGSSVRVVPLPGLDEHSVIVGFFC